MDNQLMVIETVKSVSDFASKILDSYHNRHILRNEEKRAFQVKLKTAQSIVRMQAHECVFEVTLNMLNKAWDKLQSVPEGSPMYSIAAKQFEALNSRLNAEVERFSNEIDMI